MAKKEYTWLDIALGVDDKERRDWYHCVGVVYKYGPAEIEGRSPLLQWTHTAPRFSIKLVDLNIEEYIDVQAITIWSGDPGIFNIAIS